MRWSIVATVLALAFVAVWSRSAAADGLSIGPLEYKTSLKAGEVKKGFVEVQNQSGQPVEVHLKARAFKQVNDQGGLQFYDAEAISDGIKLDLNDVTIPPHAGVHVYFLLDGSKLPSGDVFAAILASTTGNDQAVTVPSVQVGTLLLVENGTPPSHHAKITTLQAPWLQVGGKLAAKFTVQNTDPARKLTGFTPSITVSAWPYTHKTVQGPLIFAGRAREVAYTQPGNYFGPLLLRIKTGSSEESSLIFAVTGFWQWLAPLIAACLVIFWVALMRIRRHRR